MAMNSDKKASWSLAVVGLLFVVTIIILTFDYRKGNTVLGPKSGALIQQEDSSSTFYTEDSTYTTIDSTTINSTTAILLNGTIVTSTSDDPTTSTITTTPITTTSSSSTTTSTTTSTSPTTTSTTTTTEVVGIDKLDRFIVAPTEPTERYITGGCDTIHCEDLAKEMLCKIDHRTSPCEDFYQYACGQMLKNPDAVNVDLDSFSDRKILHKILSSSTTDNEGEKDLNKIRDFFHSCVGWTGSNKDFLDTVASVGDINPLEYNLSKDYSHLLNNNEINNVSATEIFAIVLKNSVPLLFDLFIDLIDIGDYAEFNLKLIPAGVQHTHEEELLESICQDELYTKLIDTDSELFLTELHDSYERCLSIHKSPSMIADKFEFMIRELSILHFFEKADKDQAVKEIKQDITNIYKKIQEISSDVKFNMSMGMDAYFSAKPADLDDINNKIDWIRLLELLDLPKDVIINIHHKEALTQLLDALFQLKSPLNTLRLMYIYNLYNEIYHHQDLTNKECLELTKKYIPDIASWIFITSVNDSPWSRLRGNVEKMFSTIKSTFLEEIKKHNNSDKLYNTILKIKGQIGAGDEGKSTSLFNFNTTEIDSGDVRSNLLALKRRYRDSMYELVGQKYENDLQLWMHFIQPFNHEGMHLYPLKLIVIPQSMMFPPFYYKYTKENSPKLIYGIPEYINFAGLGYEISKLFFQAIDNLGLKEYKLNKEMPSNVIDSGDVLNEKLDAASVELRLPLQDNVANYSIGARKSNLINDLLTSSGATRLALLSYKKFLTPKKRKGKQSKSRTIIKDEEPLKWLISEVKTPEEYYFLKIAQNSCQKLDAKVLMEMYEGNKLPAKSKINMVLDSEMNFMKSFKCHKQADNPYFFFKL